MAYSDVVAGNLIIASELTDFLDPIVDPPLFQGRQTVAQSIPNNTDTPINFGTEDFDTHNGHSTSVNTSRYTVPIDGIYELAGGASFATNSAGVRTVQFWKNGTTLSGSGTSQPGNASVSVRLGARQYFASLVAGDYVELTVFQNSGGALNTAVSGVEMPTFTVRWVAPL